MTSNSYVSSILIRYKYILLFLVCVCVCVIIGLHENSLQILSLNDKKWELKQTMLVIFLKPVMLRHVSSLKWCMYDVNKYTYLRFQFYTILYMITFTFLLDLCKQSISVNSWTNIHVIEMLNVESSIT